MEETNATTTKTLVDAAKRLVDELPEGTPADKVLEPLARIGAQRRRGARCDLAASIPQTSGQSGTAWQIFPNFQIGQGLTTALCYSARPDRLQPRQVHLRSVVLRAVSERRRAADGMGVHAGR